MRDTSRIYTWQEIEKHNHAESAWLVVKGKVYDVTHFSHPGGDMILLGAGRQSTELFLSHHPQKIIDNMEVSLGRFLIGQVADDGPITPEKVFKQHLQHVYAPNCQTNFYSECRRRVEKFLVQNAISKPFFPCPFGLSCTGALFSTLIPCGFLFWLRLCGAGPMLILAL